MHRVRIGQANSRGFVEDDPRLEIAGAENGIEDYRRRQMQMANPSFRLCSAAIKAGITSSRSPGTAREARAMSGAAGSVLTEIKTSAPATPDM